MSQHHPSLTGQSGEGELGDLDPDPAPGAAEHIHRLDGCAHHHPGGRGDEVVIQRLGDERERARHAHVALDDLQQVVLSRPGHGLWSVTEVKVTIIEDRSQRDISAIRQRVRMQL